MPGLFSKVFKKDATPKKDPNGGTPEPPKPRWNDAWQRTEVEPEEVQELLNGCTTEIKSRALEMPFLLLPFRPASDPSAARTFVRNFFGPGLGNDPPMSGTRLATELRIAEPLVLCSVMKWCWSRLAGGVVTWDAYELFKMGENDSNNARDAFSTFIPISTANDARTKIINDFFDLMAAIAAHGKSNGFPGRKLSRFAGWWAFEHKSDDDGFDGGYKSWAAAADATSHLFFAYLRSLAPDPVKGALSLPRSLHQLLEQTEYPPSPDRSLRSEITRVVMIVDSVSPTPFALLRRARNFEYRSDDEILQAFAEYDDPIRAITDECQRILQGIATANESSNSKLSTSLRDASWSAFEDIGFSESRENEVPTGIYTESALTKKRSQRFEGLKSMPASTLDVGRPTTPSWADFLSSGFNEQSNTSPATLLPPDKQLPPLRIRVSSSYSESRALETESTLGGGEIASVKPILIDDVFWWVWITSLAGEETVNRKSTFGRCAFTETKLLGSSWLLFEEVVKGAKAEPSNTGYVAEKKSRFGFRMMGKKVLKGTPTKGSAPGSNGSANGTSPSARKTIAPDQHARIQAAAAALSQKKADLETSSMTSPQRRGRLDPEAQSRAASVLTLQPVIMSEAAPAMKWASSYDKNEIRAQYLGNKFAGKGSAMDLPSAESRSIAPSEVSRDPRQGAGEAAVSTPAKVPAIDTSTPTRKPVQSPTAAAPKTPKQDTVNPPNRTSSRGKTTTTDVLIPGPAYSKHVSGAEPSTSPTAASPTASNKAGKKLPGRFGSVFTRKKSEGEKSPPRPTPARLASGSSAAGGSAVAAARAALEARTQQENVPNPRQQVTAKRTSINTDAVDRGENAEQVKTPQEAAAAAAIITTPIAENTVSPHHLYPAKNYEPSYTTDSHIDEAENHAAEREFSKFDQGSMHEHEHEDHGLDVPYDSHRDASVSDLTDEPVEDSSSAYMSRELSSAQHTSGEEPVAPSSEMVADAIEGQDPTRARALSDERWAQIKKAANDRVAARQSEEELSRKTLNTEDEGEADTSGEESKLYAVTT